MPKSLLLPALCIALGLTVCQTYQAPAEAPVVLEENQAEQPYGRPVDFD